ncbi:integrase [Ureibacillus aquaedulcis]|uniref:Integrase n=1 Tax=Ureibacillus aquaedulcis TaxID=3058421 RepID=A0ABT8GKU8_9BACL|nr:integrase [Ureibacillus sp. BA0131]MDN4492038.1 integrase [Ureibacillus sp. BA0131]
MRNHMQQVDYNDEYLYQLITSTIQAVGMENEVKQDESGINMTYNFISNCVGFDAFRLVEAWKEIEAAIPLEQYVRTLTMHELGHAIDREALQKSLDRTLEIMEIKDNNSDVELYTNEHLLSIIIEEHEMNITFEETAWRNAKLLNEKANLVDEVTFELIKNHSLTTYNSIYEEDLSIYRQVQEKSLQSV